MPHLVLLGDSIFDNAEYTEGGPDVLSQTQAALPTGWTASMVALDEATTSDIPAQVQRLPALATHLVLCVGGNNALKYASVLDRPAKSTSEAVGHLADIATEFEKDYQSAVQACLRRKLPLGVCTIYNGNFPDPEYQRLVLVFLTIFNDTILRVAIEHALPVIDLRMIVSTPEDYADPIEPSSVGGAKIARALAALFARSPSQDGATRIVAS